MSNTLFECVDGFVRPVLLDNPDGVRRESDGCRFLTAEEASQQFGFEISTLEEAFGAFARDVMDATSPIRIATNNVIRQKYSHLTDENFDLFIEQCRRLQFSPLGKGLWPAMRYNQTSGKEELSVELSADGFFAVAIRTGEVIEFIGPEWSAGDGTWLDCWVSEDFPACARFGVRRRAVEKPIYMVANWRDYAPMTMVQGRPMLDEFWQRMPSFMLGKCASCLAIRRAWPEHFTGVYGREEMGQADNPRPGPGVKPAESSGPETPPMESFERFDVALFRLGLGIKKRREAIIEEFRGRYAILYSQNVKAFYRAVYQEIARNPSQFGIEPDAMGA